MAAVLNNAGDSSEPAVKESKMTTDLGEKKDEDNPNNVTFKIVFNKQKFDVTWDKTKTISSLKSYIHPLTEVPPSMQKLMFKGLLKDAQTLTEAKITSGTKVMLVGSKLTDVISANAKAESSSTATESESGSSKKDHLSKQKPHSKVIEQGIPEDAMPAYKNGKESLPDIPLYGMLNKHRHKVRLTFKLAEDQIWLGTKERTEKLPMNSIKQIVSEPIEGHEQYHMMALQLGPTEQSRYWIYWVPSQYVDAIKDVVLGTWQF